MENVEAITISACPACGGSRFSQLAEPGHWIGITYFQSLRGKLALVKCRTCGLDFINPRPCKAALDSFYSGDTYVCHTAGGSASAGAKAEFLLKRIEAVLPQGDERTLLDFGCGGGGFLHSALNRGWRAVGFEPGRRGRETCARAGLNVVGDLAELPSHSFSVVTLHHVFEHLEDHAAVLQVISRLLSKNGFLFLEVPNVKSLRARLALPALSKRFRFDERHRAFPIHLVYFSQRPMRLLLERAGWAVHSVFTAGLGIDELVMRRSDSSAEESQDRGAGPDSKKPRMQLARNVVKKFVFGAGLGENLCVFARPLTAAP